MQENQDKETITDEIHTEYKRIKKPAGGMNVCVVCCKTQGSQEKDTSTDEVQTEYERIKKMSLMAWMFVVFVLCCVGSGFSDELITRLDVFYRACVCNCV